MPPPGGLSFHPRRNLNWHWPPTLASPSQQSPVLTRGIICLIPGSPGWLLGCRGAGTHTDFPPICPLCIQHAPPSPAGQGGGQTMAKFPFQASPAPLNSLTSASSHTLWWVLGLASVDNMDGHYPSLSSEGQQVRQTEGWFTSCAPWARHIYIYTFEPKLQCSWLPDLWQFP